MTKGLKVTALSVNFQNAISVANFVGIRYIWIDSLCIIQGAHSDFGHEGQLMHKVYRNSYCNLAAADSVDSRGGLFRRRKPTDILPGRYRGDGSSAMLGTTSWVVVNEKLWDVNLLGASIYTRGWVFQGTYFLLPSQPRSLRTPFDSRALLMGRHVQNACSRHASFISRVPNSSGTAAPSPPAKHFPPDSLSPSTTPHPRTDTGVAASKNPHPWPIPRSLAQMMTRSKGFGRPPCCATHNAT